MFWPDPAAFDVTRRYVVGRRALRFSGRDYEPGEHLPWQSLGITERRMRLLVEQRQVVVVGDAAQPPAPERTAPPAVQNPKPSAHAGRR